MSIAYVVALAAVVVVLAAVRIGVPLPAWTTRRRALLGAIDVVALTVGVLLLAAHCVSMFYPGLWHGVAGVDRYATVVADLGAVSIVLYSVPAALVLLALRRVHPVALIVVAAALVTVGVTMYDGGPVDTHLVAIFAAVVCLAGGVLFGTRVGTPGPGAGRPLAA